MLRSIEGNRIPEYVDYIALIKPKITKEQEAEYSKIVQELREIAGKMNIVISSTPAGTNNFYDNQLKNVARLVDDSPTG